MRLVVQVHRRFSSSRDEEMKDGRKDNFIVTLGHQKLLGSRNSWFRVVSVWGPEDDGLISGKTRYFLSAVMLILVEVPSDLLSDE
jgi:hypothetical protein